MSDLAIDIRWSLILPQRNPLEVFTAPFTLESLSSLIIYTICLILMVALVYVVYRAKNSRGSVSFLLSLLGEADPDRLIEQRRDLLKNSRRREYEGNLWSEFNESLVESSDGTRLYNTIDAGVFFNTDTLARGISENRLIAALPGILTAVGLLGTFLGLQFGLGSLQFEFDSMEDAHKSIEPLIGGAAVAFSTSVWGIVASVAFNMLEKALENHLQKRIWDLQNRIDGLFPRAIAEQALLEIQHHEKESEDTLKGLAEQIGDRMQLAMVDFSARFQEDFRETINPAIQGLIQATNDMANRQHSGTAEVLTQLIEEFVESVGTMGEQQRRNLETASSSVNDGVQRLGVSIDQFMEQLGTQLHTWHDQEAQRNQHVDAEIKRLQDSWGESTQLLLGSLQDTLGRFEESDSTRAHLMDEQVSKMSSQWSTTLTQFLNQIEGQLTTWTTNADQLRDSVDNQLASSKTLIQQGHRLAERSEQSQDQMRALSEDIATAAGLLESTANHLSGFAEMIESSSSSIGDSIVKASELSRSSSAQTKEVVQKLSDVADDFTRLKGELTNVAEHLHQSAETSRQTFSGMKDTQKQFLADLSSGLEDLQSQVASLMSDYADRVQAQTIERMQTWNAQTKSFSDTLRDSISTMNDIVSEIHDRIDRIGK